jgi:aspartyl-tRNA(Asn)/glutamyl-tRNA(Gln) amidotransferase subunit A
MTELRSLSLLQLAASLRAGKLSSLELADEALANMRLGAYREVQPETLRRQAAAADAAFAAGYEFGPLQGIPLSVKDLFGLPGFQTCAGSPRALPERFERTGPVVKALMRQLALISGKTHTVEFAFGGVGTNPHYPTPINPWDAQTHRAPGGSTSGGGVSLAEGSAWLALGTDTAGSVRIPAAWTGNVGLKTTAGRWSTAGVVPLSTTLDTVGVLARTVDDVATAFRVIDGPSSWELAPPELSRLRFGRCDDFFCRDASPGVAEAYEEGTKRLSAAGATVVDLELPELDVVYKCFLKGGPVAVELAHFLNHELPSWLDTLEPNVKARLADATSTPAVEYLLRRQTLEGANRSVDDRLRHVDALLCPTVANSPPPLDQLTTTQAYARANLLCLRNTSTANYLGLCALTLPVGLDSQGLPVGLQLVTRGGQEERLLAVARAVESCVTPPGGLGRPPRCP